MRRHATDEQLSAYMDDELHGLSRAWIAWHARRCAACAAHLDRLQRLRSRLRGELPRYHASSRVREGVRALLADPALIAPPTHRARPARMPPWSWLVGSALAGSVITLCAVLGVSLLLARLAARDIVAEAVADHVRATSSEQLIEIESSERHTVKPWLAARLDYSPPVEDLAAEGFALLGARIDRLHGARIATLVYRHRLHLIDVFVQPSPAPAPKAASRLRGFNVTHARGGAMDFVAVSDVEANELQAFVERLAADANR